MSQEFNVSEFLFHRHPAFKRAGNFFYRDPKTGRFHLKGFNRFLKAHAGDELEKKINALSDKDAMRVLGRALEECDFVSQIPFGTDFPEFSEMNRALLLFYWVRVGTLAATKNVPIGVRREALFRAFVIVGAIDVNEFSDATKREALDELRVTRRLLHLSTPTSPIPEQRVLFLLPIGAVRDLAQRIETKSISTRSDLMKFLSSKKLTMAKLRYAVREYKSDDAKKYGLAVLARASALK